MKPSQLASQLRRIATAIDNSKNPDRSKVIGSIRRILAAVNSTEEEALMNWLLEVLKHQTNGATIVLPNGNEAMVKLDPSIPSLQAYTYDEIDGQPVIHAQISLDSSPTSPAY